MSYLRGRLGRWYIIPVLLFGAFCLWGAFEDGLPRDRDMWLVAIVGVFLIAFGIWSVYAEAVDRAAERQDFWYDGDHKNET